MNFNYTLEFCGNWTIFTIVGAKISTQTVRWTNLIRNRCDRFQNIHFWKKDLRKKICIYIYVKSMQMNWIISFVGSSKEGYTIWLQLSNECSPCIKQLNLLPIIDLFNTKYSEKEFFLPTKFAKYFLGCILSRIY